jgi:hypothetical protein
MNTGERSEKVLIHRAASCKNSAGAEAGTNLQELSRQFGFNRSTFFKRNAKYRGMEAFDLKRLKELEEENSKL